MSQRDYDAIEKALMNFSSLSYSDKEVVGAALMKLGNQDPSFKEYFLHVLIGLGSFEFDSQDDLRMVLLAVCEQHELPALLKQAGHCVRNKN